MRVCVNSWNPCFRDETPFQEQPNILPNCSLLCPNMLLDQPGKLCPAYPFIQAFPQQPVKVLSPTETNTLHYRHLPSFSFPTEQNLLCFIGQPICSHSLTRKSSTCLLPTISPLTHTCFFITGHQQSTRIRLM